MDNYGEIDEVPDLTKVYQGRNFLYESAKYKGTTEATNSTKMANVTKVAGLTIYWHVEISHQSVKYKSIRKAKN